VSNEIRFFISALNVGARLQVLRTKSG